MSIRVKKLTSHAAAPQSASVLQRIAETEAERGRTLVNLRRSSLARLEEMQDAHDAAMLSRAELEATRQAATARALGATLNNIFTAGYLQSMQALGMLAAGQHVSFGKFIGQFLTTAGAAFAVLGMAILAAGQALAALFSGNFWAAIPLGIALAAVGGAMVVLGTALSVSKAGGGGAGHAGAAAGGYAGAMQAVNIGRDFTGAPAVGDKTKTVNLTINYGPTVGRRADGPELARAVVSALNDHEGNTAGRLARR